MPSIQIPRSKTGLAVTSHHVRLNRMSSQWTSLPPKPPPEHFPYKGKSKSTSKRKKQNNTTGQDKCGSPLTTMTSKKIRKKKVKEPWDTFSIEEEELRLTSHEVRQKKSNKFESLEYLRQSARRRRLLAMMESELDNEIQEESVLESKVIRADSGSTSVVGAANCGDGTYNNDEYNRTGIMKEFEQFRTSILQHLEAEDEITDDINAEDTLVKPCGDCPVFENSLSEENSTVSSNGSIDIGRYIAERNTRVQQSKSSDVSNHSCWGDLSIKQEKRVRRRMSNIYQSSQCHDMAKSRNDFNAEKNEGGNRCITSLIESISDGLFQQPAPTETKQTFLPRDRESSTSVPTTVHGPCKYPVHPYELPLTFESRQTIISHEKRSNEL